MAHLCKNMIEAFWWREVGKGEWFENRDLENGIIVAEDFLEMDSRPLWLAEYDLNDFIEWARAMINAPKGTIFQADEYKRSNKKTRRRNAAAV